jgi:hypothetical protein
MKLIVAIILTALLAFVGGIYMQWWSLAIAAFIIALLIPQKAGKAFLSGFLGVFILWAALAWWINMKNESILAKKIAAVLPLGGNAYLLILVTAFVGGLVGGFAALSASYLRTSPK